MEAAGVWAGAGFGGIALVLVVVAIVRRTRPVPQVPVPPVSGRVARVDMLLVALVFLSLGGVIALGVILHALIRGLRITAAMDRHPSGKGIGNPREGER